MLCVLSISISVTFFCCFVSTSIILLLLSCFGSKSTIYFHVLNCCLYSLLLESCVIWEFPTGSGLVSLLNLFGAVIGSVSSHLQYPSKRIKLCHFSDSDLGNSEEIPITCSEKERLIEVLFSTLWITKVVYCILVKWKLLTLPTVR